METVVDSRSLDVAESCSVHLHVRVDLERNITDLSANVLAFAITVSPYEQNGGRSSLRLDVLRYRLLALCYVSQVYHQLDCDVHLLWQTQWEPQKAQLAGKSAICESDLESLERLCGQQRK